MDFHVVDDLNDLKMGASLVVNRVNRNYVRRDQKMVVMKGANHDHRMSVMGDRNDLKMDGTTDVSRGLHMNDLLDDQNLDVNRVNRNCALHDQNLDAKMHGNLYPRMNVMDDLNLDASRANRNCALHDQMKDVNLDAMSHRVMYY